MSDIHSAAGHDDHDHGHEGHDDGAVHAHISSAKFYIGIFATLVTLTVLTVGVSYIHLGPLNLAVAIVTENPAAMKETLLSGKPTPITYQTPTTSEVLLKEDKEIESFPLPLSRERVVIVKAQELFEK